MPAPDWIRQFEWHIKNNLTFSLPVFKTPVGLAQIIVDLSPEQIQQLDKLKSKYDISVWGNVCTQREWLENLYILDICDRYIGNNNTEIALDIGSKNWSYLPALTAFTSNPWHGVELDAYRRYWNLSTRKAYAAYMMKNCSQCKYFSGSLTGLHGQYSLITWFLPFVKPEPLRYWGLPDHYFEPEKLLNHAWQLLAPGGIMFIMNQGQEEAEIQNRLLDTENLETQFLGEITSQFNPYKQPRFGWLVTKPL
ncbi:MAG: hypothetical protein OEW89_04280 [Gammaproteobacteria bacterium]|nr:hypothetical protein [Gammaproteobacteria bacterium]MDH5594295.1 hypothetical protein [Gammaproteobacteria bacterium]